MVWKKGRQLQMWMSHWDGERERGKTFSPAHCCKVRHIRGVMCQVFWYCCHSLAVVGSQSRHNVQSLERESHLHSGKSKADRGTMYLTHTWADSQIKRMRETDQKEEWDEKKMDYNENEKSELNEVWWLSASLRWSSVVIHCTVVVVFRLQIIWLR